MSLEVGSRVCFPSKLLAKDALKHFRELHNDTNIVSSECFGVIIRRCLPPKRAWEVQVDEEVGTVTVSSKSLHASSAQAPADRLTRAINYVVNSCDSEFQARESDDGDSDRDVAADGGDDHDDDDDDADGGADAVPDAAADHDCWYRGFCC